MSLDALIAKAAADGQLNHLSLIVHHGKNNATTWRASFRDTKHDGHAFAENADPVKALETVLKENRHGR